MTGITVDYLRTLVEHDNLAELKLISSRHETMLNDLVMYAVGHDRVRIVEWLIDAGYHSTQNIRACELCAFAISNDSFKTLKMLYQRGYVSMDETRLCKEYVNATSLWIYRHNHSVYRADHFFD